MSRILKIFAWSAGIVVLLLAVVAVWFALFFDANALRDDITRLVEKKTGRQLTIEGDLSLSFFPWLGFEAGRTSLSNAPGYEPPLMASFESASASVRLLPLLSKRIELSQITLDGVEVHLVAAAEGGGNWSSLVTADDSAGAEPETGASGFSTGRIGGVRISGGTLHYRDADGESYRVADLELTTGAIVPGEPVEFDAAGEIASSALGIEGPAELAGIARLVDADTVGVEKPRFTLTARGDGVPGDVVTLELTAPSLTATESVVEMPNPQLALTGSGNGDPWSRMKAEVAGASLRLVDFDRYDLPSASLDGSLTAPALPVDTVELKLTGDRLQGSLQNDSAAIDVARAELLGLSVFSRKVVANDIFSEPVIEAAIEVAPFSPRELFETLGYDDIETADPQALSNARLDADVRYGTASINLRNIDAVVDQTSVRGALRLMNSGEVRFLINADTVDLDRYRAPARDAAGGEAVGVDDIVIPVEALRELALDGTLKIDELRLVGIRSSNVEIGLKAAGGEIRVNPASARLYEGSYQGNIRLDATGEEPVLSLDERLTGVQFGPFSRDLLDLESLTGTLSGRITVSGAGRTSSAITGSADGDLAFGFTDGAYRGTDLWYQVRRARAVIDGQPPPPAPEDNITRFGEFSGTGKIRQGVLRSEDIAMVLPFMRVRGEGQLTLLSQEVDFRFRGDVVDRPELDSSVDDLVGVTIPIRITGTAAAPKVGIDMRAVLADVAKRKVAERLGLEGGAQAGDVAERAVDEKKEELKDKLKDRLKGILDDG